MVYNFKRIFVEKKANKYIEIEENKTNFNIKNDIKINILRSKSYEKVG